MTTRTCLVTGASRGIGSSVASALAADGWQVLAPTRVELDLSNEKSVSNFLTDEDLVIDGIVFNAGVNLPAPLGEISPEVWTSTLQVNAASTFSIISALAPRMAERGFGRIVVISSAYSRRARVGRAAYSASKAAAESLIRSTAVEFSGRGVIANAVAPGFVDTDLTRANNSEETIKDLLERVPRGRLAQTEEVARAVAFLMSWNNDYITGQTLAVDGGFSCT